MSLLDDRFIVISQQGKENLILEWQDFEGKTVSEIRDKYLSSNQNLFFTNDLYGELLDNSVKPSELFPELALTEYPDQYLTPTNYLTIMEDGFDFAIKFQVICQDKEPKIKFPTLNVSFKKSDFSNCGDIFKYTSEKLTLSHIDDKFIQNSNEISPDEASSGFFESSKKTAVYFHTTLADSALKKVSYRQNILKEIISTETTYVNDLRALIDYWKPAMKRSNYFTDQDISFFFGDLPDILKLHAKFKKSLEERGTNFDTFVSDIFLKFSTLFTVSKRFISTYAIFSYILNEKAQTNKNSTTILHNLAKVNTFEEDRDFTSYLITPVQRMPRYILFLRELTKYSPPEHPDFPYLDQANKAIADVTHEIDLFSNSSRQIAQIMSNFSKPLFIFKEGRKLIEKATVYVNQSSVPYDPYSSGTLQSISPPKEGYFYLFNDSILMTTIDQISSPKSKDSPEEFFKYPENPLFLKDFHNFQYFPHSDSIEFSFRDKRAKKGISHFLVYFKRRTDCIEFLGKLEDQRIGVKEINYENPWILWKNKYFDPRPKIDSKPLNRPLKFTKIIPSAYTQGTNGTLVETSESFHCFFGGESRDKTNNQLIVIKDNDDDIIDNSFEIDLIENTSSDIHPRSGHSICSDGSTIYVFGGKKSNYDYLDDIWAYSADTKKWQQFVPRQSKPPKRAYHCCCYCHIPNSNKRTITVFGGLNEKKKPLDDIAIFDIDASEWTVYDLFNSPSPRYLMGSTVTRNNELIIVGGRDERYIFNDVYSFDLVRKMWKKIVTNCETVFPRFGHQVVSIEEDWVVTLGGSSFEEVFVDTNTTRSIDNKNNSPSKKNGFVFYSLPPTAINVKTGKVINIDQFGNAPHSFVGFALTELKKSTEKKINRFLVFGGIEDGLSASRNSWFTIEIPSNLGELIDGPKPIESSEQTEKEEQKVPEVSIPINNDVVSNTEEMIHVNVAEKLNDKIEKENLLISREKNEQKENKEVKNDVENENAVNLSQKENVKQEENKVETEEERKEKQEDIKQQTDIEVANKNEEIQHNEINQTEVQQMDEKENKDNDNSYENQILKDKTNQQEIKENKESNVNRQDIKENQQSKVSKQDIKENKESNVNKQDIKENQQSKVSKQDIKENQQSQVNKQDYKGNQESKEESTNKLENDQEKQKLVDEDKQKHKQQDMKDDNIQQIQSSQTSTNFEKTKQQNQIKDTEKDKAKKETQNPNQQQAQKTRKQILTPNPRDNQSNLKSKQLIQTPETKNSQPNQKPKQPIQTPNPKDNQSNQKIKQTIQTPNEKDNRSNQKIKQTIQTPDTKDNQLNQKTKQLIQAQNTKDNQSNQSTKQPNQVHDNKDNQTAQKHQNENQSSSQTNLHSRQQQQTKQQQQVKNQQKTVRKSTDQTTASTTAAQQKKTTQKQQPQRQSNQKQTAAKNQESLKYAKRQTIDTNAKVKRNVANNNNNKQAPNNTARRKTTFYEDYISKRQNEMNDAENKASYDNAAANINQNKPTANKPSLTTNKPSTTATNKSSTTTTNKSSTPTTNKPSTTTTNKPSTTTTNKPSTTTTTNKPSTTTNKPSTTTTNKPSTTTNKSSTTTTNKSSTTTNRPSTTTTNKPSTTTNKSSTTNRPSTTTTNRPSTTTTNRPSTTTTNRSSTAAVSRQVQKLSKVHQNDQQHLHQGVKRLQQAANPVQQQQKEADSNASQQSIFDFQKVISKKISMINSNSVAAAAQESPVVFNPPSVTENDDRFCQQLGVDVSHLDLFNKKLVIRRLRKAFEEGLCQKVEKIKSVFLVYFDSRKDDENGNENAEEIGQSSASFTEIGIADSVNLLSSRMQVLTGKSGQNLFICSLETPFGKFKDAVMQKIE